MAVLLCLSIAASIIFSHSFLVRRCSGLILGIRWGIYLISKSNLRTFLCLLSSWYARSWEVRTPFCLVSLFEFNIMTLFRSTAVMLSSFTVSIFGQPQDCVLVELIISLLQDLHLTLSIGPWSSYQEWVKRDLNPRLPPCKGGTLPLSYSPVRISPLFFTEFEIEFVVSITDFSDCIFVLIKTIYSKVMVTPL